MTDPGMKLEDKVEYAAFGVLTPVGNAELMTSAVLKLLSSEEAYTKYLHASAQRLQDFDKELIAKKYLQGSFAALIPNSKEYSTREV